MYFLFETVIHIAMYFVMFYNLHFCRVYFNFDLYKLLDVLVFYEGVFIDFMEIILV